MTNHKQTGFTLLELMITVTIVGILASIALPSYLAHVQSTRREEAKKALLEAAQKMESYYAMNMTYDGAKSSGGVITLFPTQIPSTTNTNYVLDVTSSTIDYTLIARRSTTGAQKNDPCGDLTLNRAGSKGVSGASPSYGIAQCW